jgi:hypothetical protein
VPPEKRVCVTADARAGAFIPQKGIKAVLLFDQKDSKIILGACGLI